MSDPRREVQRLHLEHWHRIPFAGLLINVRLARLANHVYRVQLDGLGLQLQVDPHVG